MRMVPPIVQALGPTLSFWKQTALVLLGSAGLAMVAQITVPLQPVPITGQTFGVILVGLLYGSRLGAITVLVYLAEGAAGMPVFANWHGGFAVLIGPKAGYLWGFVLAAWLSGFGAERNLCGLPPSRLGKILQLGLAALAGSIVIYIPGLLVLNYLLIDAWQTTITVGLLPFIVGDLLKMLLAVAVVLAANGTVGKWAGGYGTGR